jgi:hypothetical protein
LLGSLLGNLLSMNPEQSSYGSWAPQDSRTGLTPRRCKSSVECESILIRHRRAIRKRETPLRVSSCSQPARQEEEEEEEDRAGTSLVLVRSRHHALVQMPPGPRLPPRPGPAAQSRDGRCPRPKPCLAVCPASPRDSPDPSQVVTGSRASSSRPF